MDGQTRRMPWWRSWPVLGGLGLLALAAVSLSVTYPGHLAAALPYLGLLACPLMHLVMCSGMKKGSSCDKPGDQKQCDGVSGRPCRAPHPSGRGGCRGKSPEARSRGRFPPAPMPNSGGEECGAGAWKGRSSMRSRGPWMRANTMLPNISCAPSRLSRRMGCSVHPWARHTHALLDMALVPVLGAKIIENAGVANTGRQTCWPAPLTSSY